VRVIGPVLGALSGVLLGATSIGSPAIAGYFHALRLPPREFVFALAAFSQVLVTVQVVGLWGLGAYDAEIVRAAALVLVPMLVTFAIGMRLRSRIVGFLARSALVLVGQGLRGLGVL
jgi:uncharacterized membrane protein YfcA